MSTGILIGVVGTLLVLSSPWWLGEIVGLAYESRRKWRLYRLRHDDEWAHTEPAMPWSWSTSDNKGHLARGIVGMSDGAGTRTVRIGHYRKHTRDIVRRVENAWMAGVEEERAKQRREARAAKESAE